MIKEYLEKSYNIDRLYSSYLVSSDNLDKALLEIEEFIQNKILSIGALSDNPDYMYVEKTDNSSKNISIDQVRNLQSFLHKTSVVSGKKIAVIYAADKMNINAANCCLKILEEPPSNTHLFLLTENSASLLPTINSRCIKISHHYEGLEGNSLDKRYTQLLLKSTPLVDKLAFIKEFSAKDRDVWIAFATAAELLLAKLCRKVVGGNAQISELEQTVLDQFKSSSPQYIQAKHEEIKYLIRDVNEFDLDLKASVVLLMNKFYK